MKILNYTIEANFRSLWGWSHFKIHKRPYYNHLVWGKLSVIYGQPHLEPVIVCAECMEEIQGISAGDEGWNYCEGCQQTEGETLELTMEEFEKQQR